MTYVQTHNQARLRPNRLAFVDYHPKIIDAQKIRGAVVRRGWAARLIGR